MSYARFHGECFWIALSQKTQFKLWRPRKERRQLVALLPRWLLETEAVVTRRAEDGGMATARRAGGLDPRPEPTAARTSGLALAAAAAGRAVRPRPAHRGQLAARRRLGRRLPPVLLLPRQPRAKGRRRGRAAAAPGH